MAYEDSVDRAHHSGWAEMGPPAGTKEQRSISDIPGDFDAGGRGTKLR